MMNSLMIFLEMNNIHLLFFLIKYKGVKKMKKLLLKDYKKDMGIFIDVNNNDNNVVSDSVHIPYEKLLINHSELLDKNKKYYIYCNGGIKSKKAVNILEFYGYDVTLIVKE